MIAVRLIRRATRFSSAIVSLVDVKIIDVDAQFSGRQPEEELKKPVTPPSLKPPPVKKP